MSSATDDRKADHIDLCTDGDVGFAHKTTLLEQVELMHHALPELHADELDTEVRLFGKRLRAPILIAAMTGGTARAQRINRELAQVAEQRGYGMGLGSQRPMLERPDDPSYLVRDVAPSCLLLANLAGVQARDRSTAEAAELVTLVQADALCLHLNPAMELVQPGGDRDFRGVADALARLVAELPVPVVGKETGCGISPGATRRLLDAGVRHVDVSGAGGTSWVAVETARASDEQRGLGEALRDWGVPTAASVAFAARSEPAFETIIATGGIGSGLDVARALALGAHAAGIARPILQAHQRGGQEEVNRFLDGVERELRAVMLLVGAANISELRRTPYVVGATLERWLSPPAARRDRT